MRLDWLNAFRAVMQTGTVTGAASVMLRTQPQVSRMISSLEKSLDLKLFRREGRRLVPTPEAVEFNLVVEPILHSLDDVHSAAQDIKQKRGKPISVSAEPFLLHALLPEAIQSLGGDTPYKCSVDLCIRGLGLWMSRSNVDLGVVALPFSQTDLSQVVFAEADLVAVVPANHPLAEHETIDMADLSRERFIALRPSTLLRAQIDIAASRAGVSLTPRIEVTSGVTACDLVARGLGVTAADPIVGASFATRGVAVRPLSAGLHLTYGFLVSQIFPKEHPVRRLMETIAETAGLLGGSFVRLSPDWRGSDK